MWTVRRLRFSESCIEFIRILSLTAWFSNPHKPPWQTSSISRFSARPGLYQTVWSTLFTWSLKCTLQAVDSKYPNQSTPIQMQQEYKLFYSLCNKSLKFARYYGMQDCFCCVLFLVHDEISLDCVFLALPLYFWYFYLCPLLQMKFPILDKNDWIELNWTELNHVTTIIQRCAHKVCP